MPRRSRPGDPYPNKLVELKTIGTDPTLATAFAPRGRNTTSRAGSRGSTVPAESPTMGWGEGLTRHLPWTGIWATAPLLPQRLGADDPRRLEIERASERVYQELPRCRRGLRPGQAWPQGHRPERQLRRRICPPIERRKIYDTSQPGRGNGGHTFGDSLTEPQRMAWSSTSRPSTVGRNSRGVCMQAGLGVVPA